MIKDVIKTSGAGPDRQGHGAGCMWGLGEG
jgi:hypothetical protein